MSNKRKLEKEEKEKKAPISLPNKGVAAFTKCCVCGKLNQKCYMTMAPKQKDILVKWSQVFGPEFLEVCEKSLTDQFVCSIHWDQIRDDWKGPLPEVLEKMKRENNGSFKVMLMLNSIDEEGNGNFKKFEKCRHCNYVRERDDMVLMPKDQLKLSRWVEKLGYELYNKIDTNTTNYICWSHFNLSDRLKPYYMRFLPGPPPAESQTPDRIECRYCGAKCVKHYMKTVPRNEEQLSKWVKILGQQFLQNVKANKDNRICWSHFKYRDSSRIKYSHFPLTDEMLASGHINYEPDRINICQFCGVSRVVQNMTKVPTNEELLLKWAEILGQEFLQNVRKYKQSRICWSHFKYREKPRKANNLPINDKIKEGEALDKIAVKETEMLKQEIKTEEENNNSLVPGFACSTHISLEDEKKPSTIIDKA